MSADPPKLCPKFTRDERDPEHCKVCGWREEWHRIRDQRHAAHDEAISAIAADLEREAFRHVYPTNDLLRRLAERYRRKEHVPR